MPAAILEAVIGNVAVAAALAVLAVAVARYAHRPALAHVVWLLVLIKLITPPLFTVPLPVLPAEPVASVTAPPSPSIPLQPVPIVERDAPPVAEPAPRPVEAAALTPIPEPQAAPAPQPFKVAWETALVIVWAAGAVSWAAVVAGRARRFARLLRFADAPPPGLTTEVEEAASRVGLSWVPRVRVLPGGVAPFVWAVGRPTLYFPAGLLRRLSADERLTLIAHELAHLRRRDHLVRWVEFTVAALYWWCPLAWVARRELRRLEEEACDAEVAAALPGQGYAYASAVLETIDFLAGTRQTPALASGMGDVGSLRRRLVLILDAAPSRPARRLRFALLAVGLAALALGPRLARSVADPVEPPTGLLTVGGVLVQSPDIVDEQPAEPTAYLPTPTRIAVPTDTGPSLAAALSPDGRRVAVAVGAKVVVWDVFAGRAVCILTGHGGAVAAVAFSPDGTRLATAGHDAAVKLWDATDGRELETLSGHSRWVVAVAFSPDGKSLATGGYDGTVRLWDVASGRSLQTLTGHAGAVRALAFSPDGQVLATGGADEEVRLWSTATGSDIRLPKRHEGAVRVVAFSPDGSRLATGGDDRTVRFWNIATGRAVGAPVPVPDFVSALRFSPRGRTLFVGTQGGHALNLDPASGRPRGYLGVAAGTPTGRPAHAGAVVAALVAPAAEVVYTASQDGAVFAWPAAAPPELPAAAYPSHPHPVAAVALSADGRILATAGPDGAIRLWDATTTAPLGTLPGHPRGVTALVFAAGGRLVSAGSDERVRVWDVAGRRVLRTLTYATADLRLALSADGRTLAVGGRALPTVTLWNLDTGTTVRQFGGLADGTTAIAFTPDGGRIATGHPDGAVRVWDLGNGRELVQWSAGPGPVDGIAFAADGRTAAVAVNGFADDGSRPVHEVGFFDAQSGRSAEGRRPLTHPGPVTAVAFADGAAVLTAGQDGHLYLWDAEGRPTRTVRGHFGAVRAVAPGESAVYSAGDRAAKRWPMPMGKQGVSP